MLNNITKDQVIALAAGILLLVMLFLAWYFILNPSEEGQPSRSRKVWSQEEEREDVCLYGGKYNLYVFKFPGQPGYSR